MKRSRRLKRWVLSTCVLCDIVRVYWAHVMYLICSRGFFVPQWQLEKEIRTRRRTARSSWIFFVITRTAMKINRAEWSNRSWSIFFSVNSSDYEDKVISIETILLSWEVEGGDKNLLPDAYVSDFFFRYRQEIYLICL